jgi:hypothetical protein
MATSAAGANVSVTLRDSGLPEDCHDRSSASATTVSLPRVPTTTMVVTV